MTLALVQVKGVPNIAAGQRVGDDPHPRWGAERRGGEFLAPQLNRFARAPGDHGE